MVGLTWPSKMPSDIQSCTVEINSTPILFEYLSLDREVDHVCGQTYFVLMFTDYLPTYGDSPGEGIYSYFMLLQAQTGGPRDKEGRQDVGIYRRIGMVKAWALMERDTRQIEDLVLEAQKNPQSCATGMEYLSTLGLGKTGRFAILSRSSDQPTGNQDMPRFFIVCYEGACSEARV